MKYLETSLPGQFSEFDKFLPEWALTSEQERASKRIDSSIEKLRDFHAAVFPRLNEIIDFLNQFPNDPDALPKEARALYDLSLMVMEAAAPIDLGWTSSDIEDVFPLQRFKFNVY